MITLSICIPSYNRFERLSETVFDILKSNCEDFDIIIVDNCSPRRIEDFLSYDDKRLKIIHREQSVRGERSVNECIRFADGKYALLLLDKDAISGACIEKFVSILRKSDIAGGYCELNSNGDSFHITGNDAIINFGYLSKHPSGNIYRTDIVNEFIKNEEEIIDNNPFGFDYCLAYVASKGAMMHYNIPLVFSKLNSSSGEVQKSLSFNPQKGNVYYFPKNRVMEFKRYISHLDRLDISSDIKKKKLQQLFFSTIVQVTTEYRYIMSQKNICYHYGHDTQKITVFEMLKNYNDVCKALLNTNLSYVSITEKKKIRNSIFKKVFKKMIKR